MEIDPIFSVEVFQALMFAGRIVFRSAIVGYIALTIVAEKYVSGSITIGLATIRFSLGVDIDLSDPEVEVWVEFAKSTMLCWVGRFAWAQRDKSLEVICCKICIKIKFRLTFSGSISLERWPSLRLLLLFPSSFPFVISSGAKN